MDALEARFCIVLGQRASWPELLARALETEALGFDGLYLVDHFYGLFDVNEPTHEAYTMLAALAPFTQRLRLGIIVCGNTYRNPVFLLKQAITVDHVSGGRVDFCVGAGWTEREHEAYGFPFPSAKERVDRFAEALALWDELQRNERTTFEGTYYQVLDAPFEPKSLQRPRLPLLVGGSGPRMMRLTARYADMWNVVATPEEAAAANERMDEACRREGRDPATLVRAVSPSINLLASAEAFVAGVNAYRAAGVRDIYMPWPRTEAEVPVLRQVAREIIPRLRGQAIAGEETRPGSRSVGNDDLSLLTRIYVDLGDSSARQLLDELIDHPDERFDGRALMERLNFPVHADVTRAIAALGDAFAQHGLARPWNEAQRGYLLPAATAALLARARAAVD